MTSERTSTMRGTGHEAGGSATVDHSHSFQPRSTAIASLSQHLSAIPSPVIAFAVGGALVAFAAIVSRWSGADLPLLKVGEESNIPTWFSSAQLFAIGLVLSVVAARDFTMRHPRSLLLPAAPALFLFLSLDEVAMIHERLGRWLLSLGIGTGLHSSGPWMFVFVPFVGVLAAISAWALWSYLRGRRVVLALAVSGVLVFGFAAVGLEFAANFVPENSLRQSALVFTEEYGEIAAATLLLWSALLITRYEGIRLEMGSCRVGP